MKALTLWEPWATLMAIEAKRIETRSWKTLYRGKLAIHAAKAFPKDRQALAFRFGHFAEPLELAGFTTPEDFSLGCIIAVVGLTSCQRVVIPNHTFISEQERQFGDFTIDRFAWITSRCQRLPDPIPVRGRQGLWNVPKEVEAAIQLQLSS